MRDGVYEPLHLSSSSDMKYMTLSLLGMSIESEEVGGGCVIKLSNNKRCRLSTLPSIRKLKSSADTKLQYHDKDKIPDHNSHSHCNCNDGRRNHVGEPDS